MVKKPKNKPDFCFTDQDQQVWEQFSDTIKVKKDALDDKSFFDTKKSPMKKPKAKAVKANHASASPATIPTIQKITTLPALVIGERADIAAADFRKLIRGRLPIEARLDLHALSRDEAWSRIKTWLPACRNDGKRCVLIITGKGSGALQSALSHYINRVELRPHILCCVPAAPKDGGSGAFYVYLKRK